MRPDHRRVLLLALAGALPLAPAADSALLTLANNPFTRPQILKPKPPPAPAPVVLPEKDIVLRIGATMVSAQAPMAVVDGELLAVGESIKGFRLIAVMEGRAVFVRDGRRHVFEIESVRDKARRYGG